MSTKTDILLDALRAEIAKDPALVALRLRLRDEAPMCGQVRVVISCELHVFASVPEEVADEPVGMRYFAQGMLERLKRSIADVGETLRPERAKNAPTF